MFNFSIIIPILDEKENIYNLLDEIISSIDENKFIYEILIVNDFSNDLNSSDIDNLQKYKNTKLINNKENMGQSMSIYIGINHSKFSNIVTIDGDGQNNPKDILKLLDYYINSDFKLVGGLRLLRKDSIIKIISSKIANKIRSFILKDDCLDTGCSLKVFNKDIFLKFPFFNGMHRFLPALFKGYGYKTFFVAVDHRPRIKGLSKYGTLDRLFKGIKDIVKVKNIIKNI